MCVCVCVCVCVCARTPSYLLSEDVLLTKESLTKGLTHMIDKNNGATKFMLHKILEE